MSLKQVLAEIGVTRRLGFNTLTGNWVSALARAQALGLNAKPIRAGSRRVVIAIDRDVRRKKHWIPILAIVATVLVAITAISFRPEKRNSAIVQVQTCLSISSGELVEHHDEVFLLRDWTLQLDPLEQFGGLQKFNLIATCGGKLWSGQIVATKANGDLRIKRLTPTIR